MLLNNALHPQICPRHSLKRVLQVGALKFGQDDAVPLGFKPLHLGQTAAHGILTSVLDDFLTCSQTLSHAILADTHNLVLRITVRPSIPLLPNRLLRNVLMRRQEVFVLMQLLNIFKRIFEVLFFYQRKVRALVEPDLVVSNWWTERLGSVANHGVLLELVAVCSFDELGTFGSLPLRKVVYKLVPLVPTRPNILAVVTQVVVSILRSLLL